MFAHSKCILLSTAVILTGCASVPEPGVLDVPVSEVVLNIKCELRDAVWDFSKYYPNDYSPDVRESAIMEKATPRFSRKWFGAQATTITLTLKIEQTDAATANGSFTLPLASLPSVAVISMNGGHSSRSTRSENFEFGETLFEQPVYHSRSVSLRRGPVIKQKGTDEPKPGIKTQFVIAEGKNKSLKFDQQCDEYRHMSPGSRLLAGKLGIYDFLAGLERTHQHTRVVPRALTYQVDFVITANSNIGPNFNLIPLSPGLFGGGFKLDSRRANTHTLKIVFSRLKKEVPHPYLVVGGNYDFSGAGPIEVRAFDQQKLPTVERSKPKVIVEADEASPGIPAANRRINRSIGNAFQLDQIDPTLLRSLD